MMNALLQASLLKNSGILFVQIVRWKYLKSFAIIQQVANTPEAVSVLLKDIVDLD
jgi:hypothetical protein